ncbi:phosphatidylglycerol lysyltransferase domain-containing protein [Frigidibacter sp. MR17.24]|uniref:phosphatidylglycerol lysyltransferase domain-containing protein n=1 Tax=Frigidibacter sp. MR17.24 TaxID=3127345 RepID=UPI003012E2E0
MRRQHETQFHKAQVHEAGEDRTAVMAGLPLRRIALQQLLPVAALVVLFAALSGRARALDPAALWQAVAAVAGTDWMAAVAATAVSFWAVARYDRMAHALLDTPVAPCRAGTAGAAAIAVAQTLGFGLVTGTLVRWRMLPELGLARAFAITSLASALFLSGWAVVTAAVWLAVGPGLAGAPGIAAAAVLALFAALGIASVTGRRVAGRRLPPALLLARIVAVAAVDLGAAALALWWCLPSGLGPEVAPAILTAFGAGLVSGTPAGLGTFEAVFVSMLPDQPAETLIGAVLAWRAVYFALPALIGAAAALLMPGAAPAAGLRLHPRGALPGGLRHAPAELGLARQGEHRVVECRLGTRAWLLAETPSCDVAMFDASACAFDALARPLAARARDRGRVPALYRVGPRVAVQARAAGWSVMLLGAEAVIRPADFTLQGPAQSGLRRKIAKATKAGLAISRAAPGQPLPAAEMAEVAAHWAGARGGERGFSTGRFCPAYLAGHEVFLARLDGRLVGFASFHATAREWTLDLMRFGEGLPDGTMQALVAEAIAAARAAGAARLSLAAVSAAADPQAPGPLWAAVRRFNLGGDSAGLVQFKRAFSPAWEQRYIAAPHAAALTLAAVEIAGAVARPAPLPAPLHAPSHPRAEAA